MKNHTTKTTIFESNEDILNNILKEGARKMLQSAIELEIEEIMKKYSHIKDDHGRNEVVRNGFMPERDILTPIGNISIHQPRVRSRSGKINNDDLASQLLPKYLRRIPSIDNLLPVMYLKGISTSQIKETLEPILGQQVKNLSSNVVCKLKQKWEDDFIAWKKKDLSKLNICYIWADGVYFQAKMEDSKSCTLVIIGADTEGKKHLLGINDGYRESKESWSNMLNDLIRRGLKLDILLATADGAMGFWSALREIVPYAKEQRCWVHKTSNVLDKMPKGVQRKAKSMIHDIYMAPTKREANISFDNFIQEYGVKYQKAVECLTKDRDVLLAFYDFPAESWQHLRTTNPIESTFATVKHRTSRTRNTCNRKTMLAMGFKLMIECEKKWRRLKGYKYIKPMIEGAIFEDGILKIA